MWQILLQNAKSILEAHVKGFRFVAGSKILSVTSGWEEFNICVCNLISVFAVFIKKCLRPHSWGDTNFTAATICSNQVKC